MDPVDSPPPLPASSGADPAERVHRVIFTVLQVVLAVELVITLVEGQWLNAFLIVTILAVALAPRVLRRWALVDIPAEFQVLAVVFVFSALFLGEVRSYYERIWWWDIGLHASSGLLLGIVGFLLVYVLNESEEIALHMRPRFVALFAVAFAVAVGALWEIFEFAADRNLGTTMQKPMRGDASGLTDTMWDLVVDTLGALAIGGVGWWYMKHRRRSFVEVWIHRFIERNPSLFGS